MNGGTAQKESRKALKRFVVYHMEMAFTAGGRDLPARGR